MLDLSICLPLNDSFQLRAIRREDANVWYDYLRLPEVYGPTAWNLKGVEDLYPLMKNYESSDEAASVHFAIVRSASDALVGSVGFHALSLVNRSAELSYDLSPAVQRQGLATLAARRAIEWMVTCRGFNRIQALAIVDNRRSTRVMERCGMRHEGVMRQFRNVRGDLRDYHLYAVLAEDVLAPGWPLSMHA